MRRVVAGLQPACWGDWMYQGRGRPSLVLRFVVSGIQPGGRLAGESEGAGCRASAGKIGEIDIHGVISGYFGGADRGHVCSRQLPVLVNGGLKIHDEVCSEGVGSVFVAGEKYGCAGAAVVGPRGAFTCGIECKRYRSGEARRIGGEGLVGEG